MQSETRRNAGTLVLAVPSCRHQRQSHGTRSATLVLLTRVRSRSLVFARLSSAPACTCGARGRSFLCQTRSNGDQQGTRLKLRSQSSPGPPPPRCRASPLYGD